MSSEAQAVDVFKCPVCSGNVKTGPDDVVISCTYCGSTTDERLDGFRKFLDKNKGMNKSLAQKAQVVENKLLFVPVWTAKVKADSWYKGYKTVQVPVQKTRTVRDSDGNTRTETYTDYETGYVPVQDEIHTDTNERLLARKGARFYGLEEYLAKVDLKNTEPYNFEKIKDLRSFENNEEAELTLLNAEIGEEEFEKTIHGRVADRHRSQAAGSTTELFDCRTNTEVRGTTYLQAPFALVRYKFEGDLYKAALDGHTGNVVLGEIPITKAQRAMWTILGLIGIVLALIGGQLGYTEMMLAEPTAALLLGGIAAAVVGWIMAIAGFRVLIMTQREKKG
ncbi:MAG: hypothetical protein ACW975_08825 [Candidatus Thorarchaeota archaeon]|jgi:hypothetical protein